MVLIVYEMLVVGIIYLFNMKVVQKYTIMNEEK